MANEITAADIAATKPDCLAGAGIEEKAETIGVNKANMNSNLKSLVPLSLLAGMFIGMGALFMMQGKTILKNLAMTMQSPDNLAAVMALANNQLCQGNDEMMFITVFLACRITIDE